MVHSTYRFALLTFNLLCSIEAMKESFVGGDTVVDAYGAEDKGQKLQVSLGEHDTGHGETEDEANGEDVAFVEVTASGALTTIARPRNSSLVEAVQADEAESAGEAEEDEDAEESDEVDGAKLTGEAEKTKEAENDQPHPLADEADRVRAATAAKYCFECISKDFVFCKDSGVEKCFVSDSVADNNKCVVKVKKDGVNLQVPALPAVNKNFALSAAGESTYLKEVQGVQSQAQPVAKLATLRFGDCGVFVGKKSNRQLVDCSTEKHKCKQKDCDRFCTAKNGGKQTYCKQSGAGAVCADELSAELLAKRAKRGGSTAEAKPKETCASCIHVDHPDHVASELPKSFSIKCDKCYESAGKVESKCKGKDLWNKQKYDNYKNGLAVQQAKIPAECKEGYKPEEEDYFQTIFGDK